MIAPNSYRHMMATTREEDYALYSYSGVPSQTPYSSFYVQPQLDMSHGPDVYAVQHDYSYHPHVHHALDSQPKAIQQTYSPDYSPTNSVTHSFNHHPTILSSTSDSGASVQSNLSSTTGSPLLSVEHSDWSALHGVVPSVSHHENFDQQLFLPDHLDYESLTVSEKPGYVDPSLIQPLSPTPQSTRPRSDVSAPRSPKLLFPRPPSPAPSATSNKSQNRPGAIRTNSYRAASPYLPAQSWNPYPTTSLSRRQSISSMHSQNSRNSSQSSLDSEENKGVCPIASCGRHIKDLKAHLLTHKNERPEKCPISSCEYHIKGFARKYDKNRHTLTHYKGTMVCGFCPGSGSPSEKSFNRADVFKRHLTSVHGVEQTAPNSRRRSGSTNSKRSLTVGVSGMCSTCGVMFSNVQDFYEHLDDCVLRVVQQADPCEAINEKILTAMVSDKAVKDTMERHSLGSSLDYTLPTTLDDDEDDDEEERDTKDGFSSKKSSLSPIISHQGPRQGFTYSKGGVPLHANEKGNKRRKNYPPSWNAAPEKMKMKKRVLCVFDGPRRLWKDDMMLGLEHEVRSPLSSGAGRNWITNLDVQTLRRAEGIHEATEEEKGPWTDERGNLMTLVV